MCVLIAAYVGSRLAVAVVGASPSQAEAGGHVKYIYRYSSLVDGIYVYERSQIADEIQSVGSCAR